MSFDAGSISSVLGLNVDPFARGMNQASSIARNFPTVVQDFMASPLLGWAGLARNAFDSVSGTFSKGFKLAMDMEQAEVAFGVLLGGSDKAKATLEDLSDFAAATPFEMPELVTGARNLLAFGIQQERLIPTLRAVGDISSAIGAPLGQIAEIYGKARVQGRLFMEDINQLTGRGIPIIGELAKQFGVAEEDVRKLVETGRVEFSNLERAFESLTGKGGLFAGMMDKQSKTLAGQWSTLKDNWNNLTRDLATPVMLAVMPEMENLLQTFNENEDAVKSWAKGIGEGAAFAVRSIATVSAAIDALTGNVAAPTRTNDPLAGLNPSALGTPEGREYLSSITDVYVGAGRTLAAGAETRPNRGVSDAESRRWDVIAESLRDAERGAKNADAAMESLVAKAEQGAPVASEEWDRAAKKVQTYARAVETARNELVSLLRAARDSGGPSGLVESMESSLKSANAITDNARAALNQQFPQDTGRPTINIERVVVEPFDFQQEATSVARKLEPIIRDAYRRQRQTLDTPLLNSVVGGGL